LSGEGCGPWRGGGAAGAHRDDGWASRRRPHEGDGHECGAKKENKDQIRSHGTHKWTLAFLTVSMGRSPAGGGKRGC